MKVEPALWAMNRSTGRHYKSAGDDPYRSEFRRDIGRVLYSKAFRRLAFKTQVFSPEEGDHYRNRLTHTLETAQISRVVAERLGADSELAEAIALAHDLGHPPFGHQGEHVLDRLMEPYGGFDHNLQNIRLVTLLEVKSDRYPGLNLTYETLFGIAKSTSAKNFLCELYDLESSQRIISAEARIADLADELAYTAHDFDDYARYHQLSVEGLRALQLDLVDRCLPLDVQDERIAASICVRNIVSTTVSDLIFASKKKLDELDENCTPGQAASALGLSKEIEEAYRQLATYLNRYMYQDANLKARTLFGAEALESLFNAGKQARGLSDNDLEGHRNLCDYLSGMTDRFAIALLEEITED